MKRECEDLKMVRGMKEKSRTRSMLKTVAEVWADEIITNQTCACLHFALSLRFNGGNLFRAQPEGR